MEKVLVIGYPGAGKSTFARRLRERTELPLYYLDLLWHKPDQTNVSREEFDRELEMLLGEAHWIIDGNYLRTLERRLRAADTVFLLDYPVEVCLRGTESRIGSPREDLPWIETEMDEEFRESILTFPGEQLPQIHRILASEKGKTVYRFHSREEAEDYLGNW